MTLENPLFLLFLPLLAACKWFSWSRRERGAVIEAVLSIKKDKETEAGRLGAIFSWISNFLLWVAMFVIAFSFSGPQCVKKEARYLTRGRDYFILLDVSPSMAVLEGGKTRLELAKETAFHIASSSGNDYPGLILFGSRSVVSLLPTPDRTEFFARLEAARIMDLGDSTALGSALGTALYFLKNESAGEKRIILISDGGNNSGELPPLDAAGMASDLGIQINCIAVGSPSPGGRDVVIETGENKALSARVSGNYSPEILEDIAEVGGGYYLENPGSIAVERMTSSLKSGREKIEISPYRKDLDKYFLVPGVLALLLAMFLKTIIIRELMP